MLYHPVPVLDRSTGNLSRRATLTPPSVSSSLRMTRTVTVVRTYVLRAAITASRTEADPTAGSWSQKTRTHDGRRMHASNIHTCRHLVTTLPGALMHSCTRAAHMTRDCVRAARSGSHLCTKKMSAELRSREVIRISDPSPAHLPYADVSVSVSVSVSVAHVLLGGEDRASALQQRHQQHQQGACRLPVVPTFTNARTHEP